MLGAYSLGAGGLAGDPWVIPVVARVIALRFGLPRETGVALRYAFYHAKAVA